MRILFYLLSLSLFISCSTGDTKNNSSSESPDNTSEVAIDAVSLKNEIDEMEKFFNANADNSLDKTKAALFIEKSKTYANSFPEDEMSPAFLFRAAEVSRALKKFKEGTQMLNQVYTKYPDHEKGSAALFLMAFTYEEDLNDSDSAKKYYNEFLQKYPDHKLSSQVKQLLNLIGKSPEELFRDFQEKNQ